MKDGTTRKRIHIVVDVSQPLKDRINTEASTLSVSPSEFVRRVLQAYFGSPTPPPATSEPQTSKSDYQDDCPF